MLALRYAQMFLSFCYCQTKLMNLSADINQCGSTDFKDQFRFVWYILCLKSVQKARYLSLLQLSYAVSI